MRLKAKGMLHNYWMTISLIPAKAVWDAFLVWLLPVSTRIMHSRLIWATWRLLPASIRLAAYDRLRRRHTSTTTGRVTKLPCELGLKTAHEYFPQAEADNTRFVAKHTSIPVPRILDIVESAEKTSDGRPMRAYILMTWLPGESLRFWIGERTIVHPDTEAAHEEIRTCLRTGNFDALQDIKDRSQVLPAPTLNMPDGAPLVDDLRRALVEFRSIPPPHPDAVSGLHNTPLSSVRCTIGPYTFGPFESQLAFKNAIFSQVSNLFLESRLPALHQLADPVHAKRHHIVFMHADLHACNVLVHEGRLSGIIDWEHAGWYPEYWEHTMAEYHMKRRSLEQQFWDAAHPFGENAYPEELALEWALWGCTGDHAIYDDVAVDLSCPR